MNVTPQIRAQAAAQAIANLRAQAQARLAQYANDQIRAHQALALPSAKWSSNLALAATGQVDPVLPPDASSTVDKVYSLLSIAGTAAGAYHGYRRTGKIGWTLGWALLGGLFPIITVPVAIAQGFGRPEPAFRKK